MPDRAGTQPPLVQPVDPPLQVRSRHPVERELGPLAEVAPLLVLLELSETLGAQPAFLAPGAALGQELLAPAVEHSVLGNLVDVLGEHLVERPPLLVLRLDLE